MQVLPPPKVSIQVIGSTQPTSMQSSVLQASQQMMSPMSQSQPMQSYSHLQTPQLPTNKSFQQIVSLQQSLYKASNSSELALFQSQPLSAPNGEFGSSKNVFQSGEYERFRRTDVKESNMGSSTVLSGGSGQTSATPVFKTPVQQLELPTAEHRPLMRVVEIKPKSDVATAPIKEWSGLQSPMSETTEHRVVKRVFKYSVTHEPIAVTNPVRCMSTVTKSTAAEPSFMNALIGCNLRSTQVPSAPTLTQTQSLPASQMSYKTESQTKIQIQVQTSQSRPQPQAQAQQQQQPQQHSQPQLQSQPQQQPKAQPQQPNQNHALAQAHPSFLMSRCPLPNNKLYSSQPPTADHRTEKQSQNRHEPTIDIKTLPSQSNIEVIKSPPQPSPNTQTQARIARNSPRKLIDHSRPAIQQTAIYGIFDTSEVLYKTQIPDERITRSTIIRQQESASQTPKLFQQKFQEHRPLFSQQTLKPQSASSHPQPLSSHHPTPSHTPSANQRNSFAKRPHSGANLPENIKMNSNHVVNIYQKNQNGQQIAYPGTGSNVYMKSNWGLKTQTNPSEICFANAVKMQPTRGQSAALVQTPNIEFSKGDALSKTTPIPSQKYVTENQPPAPFHSSVTKLYRQETDSRAPGHSQPHQQAFQQSHQAAYNRRMVNHYQSGSLPRRLEDISSKMQNQAWRSPVSHNDHFEQLKFKSTRLCSFK